MKDTIKFPTWFIVLTAALIVSNLVVYGILALVLPGFAFPGAGEPADYPIQFFAVRHIAFSVPLIHGLLRRDPKTLRVMYTVFVILSVLDLALLGIYGYSIPVLGQVPFIDQLPVPGRVVFGALVFMLPMTLGLRHLRGYREG